MLQTKWMTQKKRNQRSGSKSAQELQQHITKRDKNEPNRKIPILKYLKFVNGISTEMKVPVFWKTAQTQIGKHHILVSSCWESEYFRK